MQNFNISHPPPYIEKQIAPVLKINDLTKGVVWTYLVAKKYAAKQQTLINLLCNVEEIVPENSKIWLEAYLQPTRENENEYWKSRADLSVGCFELIPNTKHRISSNGDWVCVVESKWYDDIHINPNYPKILQLSQLIEHALLLHDKAGTFPKRVYVTLLTPQYFKDRKGQFSERNYWQKFQDYTTDNISLKNDLKLCTLPFLKHNIETLLNRIEALSLNWITFEELLGLPELVTPHVPGKYQTTFSNWQQVFKEMGAEELYKELSEAVE